MYKIILLSVFTFLSIFSASKVEWLNTTEHDFGDIQQGKPVTHLFEFKNISGEPFVIDNVRTSCGCTAPTWTYEPIESETTNHIEIVFDAQKKGYFRKKIMVFFSGQRKSEKLYIEGFVE